ncbi:hypothetical protein WICPIJ_005172 [Wickerhamomyces pijperi]|uniref:Uncharacterized protein n=1 Tax=Wickerhamomyces pijperi TaxID=599730 RepID=A0A9P8TM79_WICPI|nr:hypothetical protein WICPIJ_005172 [Wickerhamomyces pijperi]
MSQSQYIPVILQIGSRTIKVGFAGDSEPIVTLSTNSFDLKDSQLTPIDSSHATISDQLSIASNDDEQGNVLWCYNLINQDMYKLENLLERIITKIYSKHLLIDSKRCKAVILESVQLPIQFKETLTKVLLYHMHVKSISFQLEPIMCCLSSGSKDGVIVDLSWEQSTVTAIYDLRLLQHLIRFSKRSGRLLHYQLRLKFIELGLSFVEDHQMFNFIERFIMKCCYCRDLSANTEGTKELDEQEQEQDKFEFEGQTIPNSVRYEVIESVLFRDDFSNRITTTDLDTRTPIQLVQDVIHGSNIDLRTPLSQRLIFTGGISDIPGVKQRILKELQSEAEYNLKFKGLKNLGAWQGSSLYTAMTLMRSGSSSADKKLENVHELSRDKYLGSLGQTHTQDHIQVDDWCEGLYTLKLA